jgi:O-antigen/teichoic acid export membrane protein/peptidoglycan/xylan/chitin deacetylase (PgdA/CDA1 family)
VTAAVWRSALRRLARRRSVNVGYHGVDVVAPAADPENLCVAPDRFRTQLGLLLDAGFEIVTVAELAERAGGGEPPPGLASLSFDDGLEDNHRVLLPILREFGVPATVYVTTGFIGQPNPWMEGRARYMTADELRELGAAGIELGAHSVNHPDLSALSEEECDREVAGSVADLRAVTGAEVRTFAYPFCRYDDAAVAAVRRSGLSAAVTCEGRGNWEPYTMKRALITGRDGIPSFTAKLADLYQPAFDSGPGRIARRATRRTREGVRAARTQRSGGARPRERLAAEAAVSAAVPIAAGGSEQAFERVARNTFARAAGELVSKLASLVFFAAVARNLGQTGVGAFVFALAWAEISMLIASLGLDRALVRWIAADRSRAADLFADSASIKTALAIPVALVSFAAVNVLTVGSTDRTAIYMLTAGALFEALTRVAVSVFTAFERSELTGVVLIGQRLLQAALGIGVLAAGYEVVAVASAYSAAAVLGFVLAVVLLRRRLGVARRSPDWRRWRAVGVRSVPFAVQDVFTVLLFRIDAVLLSLMATDAAVGRYGAAYRLFESTFFLTYALIAAFAPMFTYLERDSEPTIHGVYQRSLKLALLLLVPCGVVFGTLAPFVSRAFFGDDFESAADALRILAPAVVLIGLVTLTTSLIVSRRSPTTMVRLSAAMTLFNIVLNVALIPGLEERGAAVAMLVTEAVFLVLVVRMGLETVGAPVRWAATTGAPLVAGAAMAAVTFALRDVPGLALGAGGLTYAATFVLAERLISPDDLDFVVAFVRRRLRRRPPRAA